MYSRRIDDGAIAINSRFEHTYGDAIIFGGRSMRKRLRAGGIDALAMQRSAAIGDTEHLLDFDYKITMRRDQDKRWALVRGVVNASYINLFLEGPQADEVVAKVNAALYPWLRTEQDDERARRAVARKEALAKRRKRRRKMRLPRPDRVKAGNDNEVFVPAPIAAKKKERLTPQFRKSSISWHEAVRCTIAIFAVEPTRLFTAYEIAETRLRRSLERNDVKFAQWKSGDFVLRFDTFDGVFRDEETELMISCTKNKSDPLYWSTRGYVADLLLGKSLPRQQERRARFAATLICGSSPISLAIAA